MNQERPIDRILDAGRWAPSGDNTQPWQFEIVDDRHIVVHGSDTRSHCVYDLDGHSSQLAIGALLETLAIAASHEGLQATVVRRTDMPDTEPTFDLHLAGAPTHAADPLASSIQSRSVQRRPLATRALTVDEKVQLEAVIGSGYRIEWLEGFNNRLRTARLMFDNAKLRLTLPEAYRTHVAVIEWNARFSEDRVPDQALGVDAVTARLMRWIMKSWERVCFFNKYLAGTLAPRIQMDFIPGLACAAHFALVADRPAHSIDDYVAAGRALQRFWLQADSLGLQLQPELTPLIFSRYCRNGTTFSATPALNARGPVVASQIEGLLGVQTARCSVFMGRIGAGKPAQSRSVRRAVANLMSAPSQVT